MKEGMEGEGDAPKEDRKGETLKTERQEINDAGREEGREEGMNE